MNKFGWLALSALGLVGLIGPTAHAGCGPRFTIGIGVGVPVYRPYPYYYGYPYPYPYPYYYYPPPPPPVVVQQPVIQQVPVQAPPPAAPAYQTPPQQPVYQAPPPNPVQARSSPGGNFEQHVQQLASTNDQVRADNVLQLGRLRDPRAIDPLAATLSGDRSPMVRETAARALGLIGSAGALPALQHAAQTDSDHDVRRSAQFAIEVIQNH